MPSVVLGGLLALTLAGCGLFGSSKPKPTPLTPIVERVGVRQDWQTSIGKAGNFTFLPASGGPVVLAAALDGTVVRLDNGKEVWRTSAGQKLSAGTASDGRLVVVGTYSAAASSTFVSLKLVKTDTGQIVKGHDYALPNNADVNKLLALK
mgnify:CR=1 FL=1